jgi:hypothetical protein
MQASSAEEERRYTAELVRVEDATVDWLAAADPRLAMRANVTAPEELIGRLGTEAILAEDATARIRGTSLDLFAFRARARALERAKAELERVPGPLPEQGPLGSMVARPKLEKELLERLLEEERARCDDEARLADASGDLVRGILATWAPPSSPQDWLERDVWVSKHLLEIRESLRSHGPLTGPPDVDVALYPLERLLEPLQFPRASAAIAQVRMALDEDTRAVPKLQVPERIVRASKIHLGVDIEPAKLPLRFERLEERLRSRALRALDQAGAGQRRGIELRARELLLVERSCPLVPDSKVRSMSPPPERAAVCGLLRALTEETNPAAAVVALHDDVLLSFAAVVPAPPPRTRLLSHPDDDAVDALERLARERPVVALGVALAGELLYGSGDWEPRVQAWRALGEAPLDIVERELTQQN